MPVIVKIIDWGKEESMQFVDHSSTDGVMRALAYGYGPGVLLRNNMGVTDTNVAAGEYEYHVKRAPQRGKLHSFFSSHSR